MRRTAMLLLVTLAAAGCGGGSTVDVGQTFASNHVDYSVVSAIGRQVVVQAKNTSDEPQETPGSWTSIELHVDGKKFTPTDGDVGFDTLQPGQSKRYTLTFSVDIAKGAWLEFRNAGNDSPFDRVAKVNLR